MIVYYNYGYSFEKFLLENKELSLEFKITDINDSIYENAKGNFIGVCSNPR